MPYKKTVVITGLFAPFQWKLDTVDVEVWGCNRTYIYQNDIPEHPDLTRLFFFDSLARLEHYGHKDFVKHVAALNIPVVTKRHYPEIPLSEAFPLQAIMEEFRLLPKQSEKLSINELLRLGKPYFTSSVAYMVAMALYEGFDRIVLNKMQVYAQSTEYFEQKACINFWLGIAIGRGCDLLISADSHLCRAHPWEPNLYGYVEPTQINTDVTDWLFSDAATKAMKLKHTFDWSPDLPREMAMGPEEEDILPSLTVSAAVFVEQTPEEFGKTPAPLIQRPKENKGNGTKHP